MPAPGVGNVLTSLHVVPGYFYPEFAAASFQVELFYNRINFKYFTSATKKITMKGESINGF
jgi:hypothetical protein